jgi:glycosyltransferase involved in cell wall biosynthesis
MIKVSVIIPVFNTDESFLRDSINSALQQSLDSTEVIIIDNGSTEETLNILEDISSNNKKIKLFIEPEGKQGKARNVGIHHAQGEYIAFLDSDDWLLPETLEKQYLQATSDSADILKTDFYTLWYPEKRQELTRIFTDINWYNRVFNTKDKPDFLNVIPYLWNGLYRTDFLRKNKILFNETLMNQDHLFCWQANLIAEKISLIPEAGLFYRKNYGSASKNFYANSKDLLVIYDLIESFLKKKGFYESYKSFYLKSKLRDFIYIDSFINDNHIRAEYLNSLKSTIADVPSITFSNHFSKDYIDLYYLTKSLSVTDWFDYVSIISNKKNSFQDICRSTDSFFHKFNDFIKNNSNKKICLYGAGIFAKQLADKLEIRHFSNILGFIDKNPDLTGKQLLGYTIYHPTSVKELKPDVIIPTMQNPSPVLDFIENMKFFYNLDFEVVTI